MIGMSTILAIKQRAARGDSVAQIAREEGISEPTVRKYRDMDDFSPQVKPRKRRGSKLDPFKATIDRWLAEDRKRRPKQRHTAQRVFDRLVAECGYDGSYTIVQAYVKKRKAELKGAKDEFLNLEWAPGEGQVDFGVCDFRVLGVMREVHYLVVTFPFSNVSLAQCFWGETSECVCEGLKAVFEFCGGVPTKASDPMSQLALLCRKPGGWQNSAVRATLPKSLARSMDSMGRADRGTMLRMLRDVSADAGYEAAVAAMAALGADGGVPSRADVALAAACTANGQGSIAYDDSPDLGMYDAVFAKEA